MPLPKPKDDEKQQEFIGRCMGDDTMNEEYPDREQRAAVCFTQWRKTVGKSLVGPDKDVRAEMSCPTPELEMGSKGGDGDYGWLEGYASVFDLVDAQNEVVRKGAFAKSLKERMPQGKIKLMARHMMMGGDTLEVVGTITEAKEDKRGLWIHAEFAGTSTAQEVRQLVTDGHVAGLSIGYIPVAWGYAQDGKNESVVELKEVKLLEVTITALPANEQATITAAKAVCEMAAALQRDVSTPDEGRTLPKVDGSRIAGALAALDELRGKLEALLGGAEPEHSKAQPELHSVYIEIKRRWLDLQAMKLGMKSFTHSNKTSDDESGWGKVDKTKLPRAAFADRGEADKVSSWSYPHHWVSSGGSLDDDGRYTSGTMLLHKGGLNAAWAAAQGARAGREASAAVKSHLNAHRKALGLEEG